MTSNDPNTLFQQPAMSSIVEDHYPEIPLALALSPKGRGIIKYPSL
jgi:hypothetical protein